MYSIWVHVESSKYKKCLKSPKSNEIAGKKQQWSKILNYVYVIMFNNYLIEFKKKGNQKN